jgi:hypothetical protein
MSAIFGELNIADSDRVFNATVGQRAIYDIATAYVARVNAEVDVQMGMFVDETTEEYKRRYKLPGSGFLQERGPDGRYVAVKAIGQWDVAFPLRDMGAQIAGNDVDMAYMTVAELDRHLQTVTLQNVNSVRYWIMKALFDNTEKTFVDPIWGSLACEPLANGDAVLYPPIQGATAEAVENHMYGANYLVSAIDATHNPVPTIKAELEEHFGVSEGGSNIIIFVDPTVTPYLRALGATHWTEYPDPKVILGSGISASVALGGSYPGTLKGRCDGCWIIEWLWMPAGYMVGIDPNQPRPIIRRIDPADTGLGNGLQLVATDEVFPFRGSFWRHRFGMAVGNRLNGVVLFVTNSTSYTIPTAYQ